MLKQPAAKPIPKGKPETVRQAIHWETVKNAYLIRRLCHRCAAQAAWGHQCGFSGVHPPCVGCQPIVDGFLVKASGESGWRKHTEHAHRAITRDDLITTTALPGVPVPAPAAS